MSSETTVRYSDCVVSPTVRFGNVADAVHARVDSRANSGIAACASAELDGPISTRAPPSTAAWIVSAADAPSGVGTWLIVSSPPSTPPPASMSAAASLMPRSCPSNRVSRSPGGGTSTPTVRPPVAAGVVSSLSVAAGASVAGAVVSSAPAAVVAVVESGESSSEHPATMTAASTHDVSTRTALRKSDLAIASPCRSTTLRSRGEAAIVAGNVRHPIGVTFLQE